ncbi:DUF1833 family protein [Chromobacterium haemolyticum]|uniref:DUF1833 family protein n=1 Tax=Chromobacterium haemolyticum TaxID=394935 RepID=UPI0009D96FB7|nr:DUF1833 family protein [Chromobacterium haemolyticum]
MARAISQAARENINATSAAEPLLMLLEISHEDLAEPARVVNDSVPITVEGHVFVACSFSFQLPEESEGQVPQAQLAIDNVGRELTKWIDVSQGGAGSQCRVIQVLRSQPKVLEYDITLDLSNVAMTPLQITATLGYVDFLNQPAVALHYRPETAPGVF